MRFSGRQRPSLYKILVLFLVVSVGIGAGDYLVAHGGSIEASVALGIGCGLIVVLMTWMGDGHKGVR